MNFLVKPVHRMLQAAGLTYTQRRLGKILSPIPRTGLGLEIGPSHNPITPRRDGWNVRILDYTDKPGLLAKYQALGIDGSKIEDVDYVWNGQPYRDMVGDTRFDWIISSHSIEHMPDMAGFLADCHSILKPGGLLVLAVPDHRRTFDCDRNPTSLASIIDAHLRKDTRPTPGAVAEFHLSFCQQEKRKLRNRISFQGPVRRIRSNTPRQALSLFRDYLASDAYQDVHVWCFTPRSFSAIIADLIALEVIPPFRMHSSPISFGGEFFAALVKSGEASTSSQRIQ